MELMNTLRNDNSKFPFTSTQWQELEHQALVYKYMISGLPIPHDLLFSIKTSLDSSAKLILHHHSAHQSIGWNCFHMGFGRKIDPEPGRCRRTDGKKWRCAKEAYPDSKYCEKHMHRGRNRSRKPVELSPPPPLKMSTKSLNYPSPISYSPFVSNHHHHPLSSSSSSSRYHADVLSSQDGFLLESSPYSHSEKDYSCRIKHDANKHPFLSENRIDDSWRLEPLAMSNSSSSSLAQSKQQTLSDYCNDYSYLHLQNTPRQRQKQDQEHCYNQLGFKIDRKDEPHEKVMHHFFDESPPHNDNDNDNDDRNKDNDSSKTQLSIAIPSYAHDFFMTNNGNFTL